MPKNSVTKMSQNKNSFKICDNWLFQFFYNIFPVSSPFIAFVKPRDNAY